MTHSDQILILQRRIALRQRNKMAVGPLEDRLVRLRLLQLRSEIRAERKQKRMA